MKINRDPLFVYTQVIEYLATGGELLIDQDRYAMAQDCSICLVCVVNDSDKQVLIPTEFSYKFWRDNNLHMKISEEDLISMRFRLSMLKIKEEKYGTN